MSFPTVSNSVEHLERLGILKEITGRQRSRLFVYDGYLSILGEGTELSPLIHRSAEGETCTETS